MTHVSEYATKEYIELRKAAENTVGKNVCAVCTAPDKRGQGIAGELLNCVCNDMSKKGIDTLYLVTDHTSFYERYGWEFLCMVQGDGEPNMTRMYIHKA